MAVWEELRIALARLIQERPGAVILQPDLDGDGGTPPYQIGLAPWAEVLARSLHERFGDLVELTVGALPYPPGGTPSWQPPRSAAGSGGKPPGEPGGAAGKPAGAAGEPAGAAGEPAGAAGEPAALLDPDEATAELDGPAVVSSGHTLRHGLLLRNHTGAELAIATNGQVTAVVVDPRSGEAVGGYAGFQTLPLIMFRVAPGGTERIPLLIGTASFTARIGYTVPPGSWAIQATLEIAGSREERIRRRTPTLPLTVTE